MKTSLQRKITCAAICTVLLMATLTSCSGGGGDEDDALGQNQENSKWDEMDWDEGVWQ